MTLYYRFDKDDSTQSKKLDDMDLDDILNRAEAHETMTQDGGTSLGGEAFLTSFAAVSDVKNDMNWEDIIPLDERQKFESEEDQRKAEELAAQESESNRKRTHAQVSYEGMDVDHPPSNSAAKKPKVPGIQRKSASQKAMELKERDVRVLIRSLQRWGDIRQRYEVIVSVVPFDTDRYLMKLSRSRSPNYKIKIGECYWMCRMRSLTSVPKPSRRTRSRSAVGSQPEKPLRTHRRVKLF